MSNYKDILADKIDELREIEGFPKGTDEDILNLSDPPYYTACPNPFIEEFILKNGSSYNEKTDNYHKEPFLGDISFGRNDPMLNAHFYHTKVPPKAIQEYIEHYTSPGEVVFDGFCGTGTTGIAANRSGRYAVLMDLSPIATFITANQNIKVDAHKIAVSVQTIEKAVKEKMQDLYRVLVNGKSREINYTIWSDAYSCPICGLEYFYFDKFVNFENDAVFENVTCSGCSARLNVDNDNKVFDEVFDDILKKTIKTPRQKPVMISYLEGRSKRYKVPDTDDISLIGQIQEEKLTSWVPSSPMMNIGENWGDLWRAGYHKGYTHTHHFYTKRNLIALSILLGEIKKAPADVRNALLFIFTSLYSRSHRMNRYIPKHGRHVGPLSGTLYMSSLQVEINVFSIFKEKASTIISALSKIKKSSSVISTQSVTAASQIIPINSIDYIYTDPPFGDNLPYSELNFIMEEWLRIHTDTHPEAIINNKQEKRVDEYNDLMLKAFQEYYKVLKPNRWLTVVFHNSQSKVWTAIQEAITKAGFIISSVSVLDKKKGTTKQLSYNGAVKNDLVISAFKPKNDFTNKLVDKLGKGLEAEFVNAFLEHLPIRPILERTKQMLYSKIIAYYLQHGYDISFDARSFYSLLRENFIEEDGFWFTANQINSYSEHRKKLRLDGVYEMTAGNMFLFISDEKSALAWLFNFLSTPHSYSDIHKEFTQLANVQGDNVPELMDLLEQNFILENDKFRRPKSDAENIYVAEKRDRALQREFETLLIKAKNERNKIKLLRKEALLFGFEQCYKTKRFEDILTVAKKLDKAILENSTEIKDFVEAAEIMVQGVV